MSTVFKFCPKCAQPLQPAELGGATRLRCPDEKCDFVHWDNPVPVVAAIVQHEGEIVLARNVAWPGRFFGLITGFLEKKEDPAAAVLREVEEELGLKGRDPTLVGLYPFERLNQIIIAYHVPAEGEIRLNEELAEYKRFAPEKVRPWPAATGLALRDWLVAQGHSPQFMEWPPKG